MRHVTQNAPEGTLERLKARRDSIAEGRYECLACLDTGLIHVARHRNNRPTLAVVPCTECAAGGEKHIRGNVCIWAQGINPCALCGAHEGEQVPAGYTPKPPAGFVAYDELPGWGADHAAR